MIRDDVPVSVPVRVRDGLSLAAYRWPAEPRPSGPLADPPFLLVHGLASNARLWDGVAARLSEAGHEAVAVDLRGHGRSDKPDGPYDVPTVADDLAALIAELPARPPGRRRPVVGRERRPGARGAPPGARPRDRMRRRRLARAERPVPDVGGVPDALAPPRLAGRPLAEIEGHVRSAHPDWPEAGPRGTLANFEMRDDGTIAPWLTFDRHLAILRGIWDHHPRGPLPGGRRSRPARAGGRRGARADGGQAGVGRGRGRPPARRAVQWLAGDHDIHAQHPDELAGVLLELVSEGFFG